MSYTEWNGNHLDYRGPDNDIDEDGILRSRATEYRIDRFQSKSVKMVPNWDKAIQNPINQRFAMDKRNDTWQCRESGPSEGHQQFTNVMSRQRAYMIPHGLSSVHFSPLNALLGPGINVPLTQSQKNLRKNNPQAPAHTVSIIELYELFSEWRKRDSQTEAKMATYWAHWCQMKTPMIAL